MVAAVMRAGGIIDRVSSLYRRGTPDRELVDLNEIVREMSRVAGRYGESERRFNPHRPRSGASDDDSRSRPAAAGS